MWKKTDCMILSLSKGLTTVLDAAPATPPAMKYDEMSGLRMNGNNLRLSGGSAGSTTVAWEVVDVMMSGSGQA